MTPETAAVVQEILPVLYGTVTERGRWQRLCEDLHGLTGFPVQLYGHCLETYGSLGIVGAGYDDGGLDAYHEYYGALNPWMHMNLALRSGEVGVSDKALERRDLFRTEFYNDWLHPYGKCVTGAAMICDRGDSHFVGMSLGCRDRDADDKLSDAVAVLEALSPHVSRAIGLAAAFEDAGNTGAAAGLIDRSDHAVFLIARSGRVACANAQAERLLRESSALALDRRGRLRAGDPAVQDCLTRAAAAFRTGQPGALPQAIALAAAPFGDCLIHAHRLPDGDVDGFPENLWSDPVAGMILVAGPAGLSPDPDYRRLARALGATAAEARLAAALMAGKSPYDFAERAGLSRHTVRNQMRALQHKLLVRNQAGLIRKLQRLASPFRADPN